MPVDAPSNRRNVYNDRRSIFIKDYYADTEVASSPTRKTMVC